MSLITRIGKMFGGGFGILREYHDRLYTCLNTPFQRYTFDFRGSIRDDFADSRIGIGRRFRKGED